MKIAITGATGFIGACLVKTLLSRSHSVLALVAENRDMPLAVDRVNWRFNMELSETALLGVDAIVHLAHDFTVKIGAQNTIKGTQNLFESAVAAGVSKQIFVSSYSAGLHAESEYGKTKYAIERFFSEEQQIIIRPGLVLGDAGIYGRIKRVAQSWPVIPLPAANSLLPIISIESLVEQMTYIIENTQPRLEHNIFEPKLVSLQHLVRSAANVVGRKPIIVPFPVSWTMLGLGFLEALKIKLPVNRDNLKGMIANQNASHHSTL